MSEQPYRERPRKRTLSRRSSRLRLMGTAGLMLSGIALGWLFGLTVLVPSMLIVMTYELKLAALRKEFEERIREALEGDALDTPGGKVLAPAVLDMVRRLENQVESLRLQQRERGRPVDRMYEAMANLASGVLDVSDSTHTEVVTKVTKKVMSAK